MSSAFNKPTASAAVDLTPVIAGQAALSTHIDALVAPLATAAAAAASQAAILAAIAGGGGGALTGEVRQFVRSGLPAIGWSEVPGSVIAPTSGIGLSLASASINGSGYGLCVYVTGGGAAGLWRALGTAGWQRFSIDTGLAVGAVSPWPITVSGTDNRPFAVAIGKYIYMGGLGRDTSGGNNLYRFDTETGIFTALANFPRLLVISSAAVLADGRILVSPSTVWAVSSTPATTYFYLYDPSTNATPIEVLVNIGITKFIASGMHNLALMPSGKVLIVDEAAPNSGNRLSTLLTITGNTITAGAQEDTGSANAAGLFLLKTIVGAHSASNYNIVRTYVEGQGWGTPSLSIAYQLGGSTGSYGGSVSPLPLGGWAMGSCLAVGGGGFSLGLFLVGSTAYGSTIVSARKI